LTDYSGSAADVWDLFPDVNQSWLTISIGLSIYDQQLYRNGHHGQENNHGNYHLYNGRPRLLVDLVRNPDLLFLPFPAMLTFVGRFHKDCYCDVKYLSKESYYEIFPIANTLLRA